MRLSRAIVALGLPLLACAGGGDGEAGGDPGGSPGPAAGPRILAVEPEGVPFRSGGTVRIEGTGLSPLASVRVGERAAQVIEASADALVVVAPPVPAGGRAPLVVATDAGEARHEAFRYLGIPPPELRFVEEPAGAAVAAGDRVVALRGPAGPRVVVIGPGGLALLEPAASGALALVGRSEAGPLPLRAACAADFDGDGDDDLFLAGDGHAVVHRHDPGGLAAEAALPPLAVAHAACGDHTGDGAADVLVVLVPEGGLPALKLLRGDGAGGLAPSAGGIALGGPPSGIATGDVDGDGAADVLVGRVDGPPRLYLGDGFGGFAPAPPGSLPAGGEGALPALGDLDGDGRPDALLLGPGAASLWVNDGTGRFADHSGLAVGAALLSPRAVQLVDLDVDGALDVLALDGGRVALLRNDGAGRLFDYSDAVLARPLGPLLAAAAADLDADGDLDLLALRDGAAPVVLRSWDPLPFDDPDLDGVPSSLDGCPLHPDPDQANTDAVHFGCATAAACREATGCELRIAGSGRAYLLCLGAAISHGEARAFCARRGAALLGLDDPAEQALVAGFGPLRSWIDLSDAEVEGAFVSASGAAPSFTAWGPGQPDDAGGAEDCVELNATDPAAPSWNDLPCDHRLGFVCEDDPLEPRPDPPDACDVCPYVHDPDQRDSDGDGVGDACEPEEP